MVRTAFLIGNKTYSRHGKKTKFWEDIPAAFHDVDAVYEVLEEGGFDVDVPLKDATAADLHALPRRTADKLRNTHSSLALWFYSGHGVTHGGRLFLIPSDFMASTFCLRAGIPAGLFLPAVGSKP